MDPLSAIGAGASVIGTVGSAIGQANAAAATEANANYQAAVARNNQTIANQNATYALQAGQAATTRGQLRQRDYLGGLKADFGASGIDVNTGSAAKVLSSAAQLSQTDVANIGQAAALRAYGYRARATDYGAQAGLYKQEASQASTAGLIGAGGTLLSGFGSLSSKWSPWFSSSTDNLYGGDLTIGGGGTIA